MKFLNKIMTVAMAGLLAISATPAQERMVKMGTMVWDDLGAVSRVTKKFLEKQGYTVELETFSEWGIAFAATVRGDVDILPAQIFSTQDYWDKNHQRLERISVPSHGLIHGMIVPNYMSINSIEELNNVRDAVGGRIIGIEPGAGIMRESAQIIKDYGLNYQLIDGSTPAMTAALQSALERKEPFVTVMWEPSWMATAFEFKYLNDPKGIFAAPQTYYWIGRKGVAVERPHLRESLASIFIPIDDVSAINAATNSGMTIDEAVDDWWDRNQDLVNRWAVMAD